MTAEDLDMVFKVIEESLIDELVLAEKQQVEQLGANVNLNSPLSVADATGSLIRHYNRIEAFMEVRTLLRKSAINVLKCEKELA